MIRQLSNQEYEQLAEVALKQGVPPPLNLKESPVTTCKAVHRHLCDGAKVSDLTPYEQQFAGELAKMRLATVEEWKHTSKTGNWLPAVEVYE